MNINEVLEIIKRHIDFVDNKRLQSPISGWENKEWEAFWDGHIRCATILMNELNIRYSDKCTCSETVELYPIEEPFCLIHGGFNPPEKQ